MLQYRPSAHSVAMCGVLFCTTQLYTTTGHLTSFLPKVLVAEKDILTPCRGGL
jgi:hypothetical protein